MNVRVIVMVVTIALSACSSKGHDSVAVESLNDRLGFGSGDKEHVQRALRSKVIQKRITNCMKQQGFRYIAFTSSDAIGFFASDTNIQSDDYRRQHGYGIRDAIERGTVSPSSADPNHAIRKLLSANEQRPYDRALFGGGVEDAYQRSCTGAARLAEDTLLAAVGNDFHTAFVEFTSDRTVRAIQKKWVKCMAKAGYQLTDSSQVVGLLDADIADVYDNAGNLDSKAIESLFQKELSIAAEDLKCLTKEERQAKRRIEADYQANAIRQHNAAFDRYRKQTNDASL